MAIERLFRSCWASRPRTPVALHYAYFATLAAVFSLLFHCYPSTPQLEADGTLQPRAGVVDGVFLVVSALTGTGLTTVPLSRVSRAQQAILWLLMVLGSAIWVSFCMLLARRQRDGGRREMRDSRDRRYYHSAAAAAWGKEKAEPDAAVLDTEEPVAVGSGASVFSGRVTPTPSSSHHASPQTRTPPPLPRPDAADIPHPEEPYARKLLSRFIPLYVILWLAVATAVLPPSISQRLRPARDPYPPLTGYWTALFLATSSFTNCGMTLNDDNLEPFRGSYVVLTLTGSLVLAGNTAFPALLRLLLWCVRALSPRCLMGRQRSALSFVLRFPRTVYTHLFPARQTWWLVAMLGATILVDWVAFEVMSIGNPVLERIPFRARILDGLFQAICEYLPPAPCLSQNLVVQEGFGETN